MHRSVNRHILLILILCLLLICSGNPPASSAWANDTESASDQNQIQYHSGFSPHCCAIDGAASEPKEPQDTANLIIPAGIAGSCFVSTPNIYTTHFSVRVGGTYDYTTRDAECSCGQQVEYRFYWGDGEYSSWQTPANQWTRDATISKTWTVPETFYIRSQARCASNPSAVSAWSASWAIDVGPVCTVPIPQITDDCQTEGMIHTNTWFLATIAYCDEGYRTDYQYDWGDGTLSTWGTASRMNVWTKSGNYAMRVRSRCPTNHSVVSDWSSPHIIAMDAPPVGLIINANISDGGSYSGAGTYPMTSAVAVEAFPNPGYIFHRWLEDSTTVSRNNPYEFELLDHRTLILQFRTRIQPARITGTNRFDTAIAVSRTGWVDNSTDVVILARSHDFADALAGVPLAHALNAPILLTRTDRIDTETLNEIARLGASRVILLGGPGAITEDVRGVLEDHFLTVDRLYGSNRYATAAAIARHLADEVGPLTDAIIAVGTNFPDALSAASYAAIHNQPILLVQNAFLPEATAEVIVELGIQNAVVAGGVQAVSDAVMHLLPLSGTRIRIADTNRYTTSVAMAKHFALDTRQSHIATGTDFPDAISGAVLAAKYGSGILLVNGVSAVPPISVQDFIVDQMVEEVFLYGGSGAISTAIESWF